MQLCARSFRQVLTTDLRNSIQLSVFSEQVFFSASISGIFNSRRSNSNVTSRSISNGSVVNIVKELNRSITSSSTSICRGSVSSIINCKQLQLVGQSERNAVKSFVQHLSLPSSFISQYIQTDFTQAACCKPQSNQWLQQGLCSLLLQRSFSTQNTPKSGRAKAAEDRAKNGFIKGSYSVDEFSREYIRNFSIIAHVDHGKSTLADRLLEKTGAISEGGQSQYLDKLQVERERGITVKAQTASLVYHFEGDDYLLNLIDTPGHVDFSYEVSRSLAACQGAVLLVDAAQGVQAQTVANFFLAFEQGLDIIPAINKIDLPSAEPEKVVDQMVGAMDMDPAAMLYTSGRAGIGLDDVLQAVIKRIRPPSGDPNAPLRMLLVQAFHDMYKGVVCLVNVVDGSCQKGQKVQLASTGQTYELLEVGILAPEPHATGRLLTGQVGYIVTGMKHTKNAQIGDTFHLAGQPAAPLAGFKPVKAMVYAGLFPISGDDFEALSVAMDKLTLDDASVSVQKESSEALGPGFRCGFLGMLHMEVFMQRLEQEFGASVVTTAPTVPYILHLSQGQQLQLRSASEYPMGTKVNSVQEPTVLGNIVTPVDYMGKVMELCGSRRGDLLEQSFMGNERTLLRYQLPLAELAGNFYGDLKARTHGAPTGQAAHPPPHGPTAAAWEQLYCTKPNPPPALSMAAAWEQLCHSEDHTLGLTPRGRHVAGNLLQSQDVNIHPSAAQVLNGVQPLLETRRQRCFTITNSPSTGCNGVKFTKACGTLPRPFLQHAACFSGGPDSEWAHNNHPGYARNSIPAGESHNNDLEYAKEVAPPAQCHVHGSEYAKEVAVPKTSYDDDPEFTNGGAPAVTSGNDGAVYTKEVALSRTSHDDDPGNAKDLIRDGEPHTNHLEDASDFNRANDPHNNGLIYAQDLIPAGGNMHDDNNDTHSSPPSHDDKPLAQHPHVWVGKKFDINSAAGMLAHRFRRLAELRIHSYSPVQTFNTLKALVVANRYLSQQDAVHLVFQVYRPLAPPSQPPPTSRFAFHVLGTTHLDYAAFDKSRETLLVIVTSTFTASKVAEMVVMKLLYFRKAIVEIIGPKAADKAMGGLAQAHSIMHSFNKVMKVHAQLVSTKTRASPDTPLVVLRLYVFLATP